MCVRSALETHAQMLARQQKRILDGILADHTRLALQDVLAEERQRKGRGKADERQMKGKGKAKERQRKGRGRAEERKQTN